MTPDPASAVADVDLPPVVARFLAAVDDREPGRVAACFALDATYHFLVPRPPVVGRDAIERVFARVLGEASRVRWNLVSSASAGPGLVFTERVDHFWYRDRLASIECVGVLELDGDLIRVARDYADHETWSERRDAARDPARDALPKVAR